MEIREGQTATHKDGRKIIFKDGAWRVLSGATVGPSTGAGRVKPLDPQRLANLRAMENQIERVRSLYSQGPGATSGISGALDMLPIPRNTQFDKAAAGLSELGLAAFRVPGVGSQSDAELRSFVAANKPQASDYDVDIQEKLRNMANRLGETYKALKIQPKPRNINGAKSGGIEFLGYEGE